MTPALPVVDGVRVRERIARLLDLHEGGALVFDADGTLWTHDVGCMVFDAAIEGGAFKDSARDRMQAEALRLGHRTASEASTTSIVQALALALSVPPSAEQALAEFQVWAYVDFSEQEFRSLCRSVLGGPTHALGLHHDVLELAAFARERGAATYVVSASPRIVVEEALAGLGFDTERIVAGDPNWTRGCIDVGLGSPLPYGPQKAVAGRTILGSASWVATFGDSGFDLDMMREAKLAVGLGQKPQLLEGLRHHPNAVLLGGPRTPAAEREFPHIGACKTEP